MDRGWPAVGGLVKIAGGNLDRCKSGWLLAAIQVGGVS
jgi:hypothetical protein